MLGLLIPLRFWRGGAPAPTYVDAPAERYVWAPPDVRDVEVAPGDPPLVVEPLISALVTDPMPSEFVAAEPDRFVVPPEERRFTA